MPIPASQSFSSLTGDLGTGSVTLFGLTLYSDDPAATISVTADHHLSFGTGAGTHVVGYKSADGSNFSPTGGNGLGSFSVYSAGSYTVELLRDGVVVAGSSFTNTVPVFADVTGLSSNIDEVRFTYTGGNLILDDLNFSAPVRSGNAPPVVAGLSGDTVHYTEGDDPVLLDRGQDATVTDDADNFKDGAVTVAITANGVDAEDVLGIRTGSAIRLSSGMSAGSIVSVSGVAIGTIEFGATGALGENLTVQLNANADAARVQALVQALTYTNTNTFEPSPLSRSLSVSIRDSEGGTSVSTVTVDITPTPDAPVPGNDRIFVSSGTTAILPLTDLLANDTGPFGAPLTITGLGSPTGGTLFQDGAGNFGFTPAGDGSFTYAVTNGDGTAQGTVAVTVLAVTAGNDIIVAPTGPGQFSYIDAAGGDDTITGGAGRDTLLGGDGNDRIRGGLDADKILGGAGDDTLFGDDGQDRIEGGAGNDRLDGGAGADVLVGGDGNDTYYVDNSGDVVDETGSAGLDKVYASVGFSLADPAQARGAVEVLVLTGSADIDGAGNTLANALTGNSGRNVLSGAGGDDVITANAGDDTLLGGAGKDVLKGGDGNDLLNGGTDADKLLGGNGNDTYYVDNSGDVVDETGGTGLDKVYASVGFSLASTAQARGDVESLVLTGTADIDGTGNALANTLTGNSGRNVLSGADGDDSLTANAGDDTLLGGAGMDVLRGGDGNDLLDGGAQADKLIGGLGADSFVYTSALDSRPGVGNYDAILDFSHAEGDRIDLAAIDAQAGVAGDQAFTFVGTAAFTGQAGELRYAVQGADVFVYADTNGDAVADFALRLAGVASIASADFIL